VAAERLRELNEAQAQAAMQTNLTNTRVQVQIVESQAEAELARARKQAEQTIVAADAALARARREAEQTVVTAEAHSRQQSLAGRGSAERTMQEGLSEAAVLLRKIASYGDPRLYALSLVTENLAHSAQPLVPERVFVAAAADGQSTPLANGVVGTLLALLTAEKSGFAPADGEEATRMKDYADQLAARMMDRLSETPNSASAAG
jgi:hypothetical protein